MLRLMLGGSFAVLDASATIATITQGSHWGWILAISIISSLVVLAASVFIESVLFAEHFWEDGADNDANPMALAAGESSERPLPVRQ